MNTAGKVISFILGLIVGLFLATLVGVFLLFNRARFQQQNPQIQLSPTQFEATDSTDVNLRLEAIFNEAEIDIANNNLDAANELLLPLTEELLSTQENARLYADLGKMELQYGHTRLACNYFKKQVEYDKYPEGLYVVAEICYASGELDDAMNYYQQIIDWEGSDADDFRGYAQEALDHIRTSLGTQ